MSGNRRDSSPNSNDIAKTTSFYTSYVRTSRSEDHLQFQKDSSISAVDIEIDEDVTSSLNTLLDTRVDSTNNVNQTPTTDRIVWTYNAPVNSNQQSLEGNNGCHVMSNGSSSSQSSSTNSSGSPLRSTSPASPTSVSSSVMSSHSSSHR